MTATGSRDASSSYGKIQRSNWQCTNERHAADCQQLSDEKIDREAIASSQKSHRHKTLIVPTQNFNKTSIASS
jgi:hypothetical protein